MFLVNFFVDEPEDTKKKNKGKINDKERRKREEEERKNKEEEERKRKDEENEQMKKQMFRNIIPQQNYNFNNYNFNNYPQPYSMNSNMYNNQMNYQNSVYPICMNYPPKTQPYILMNNQIPSQVASQNCLQNNTNLNKNIPYYNNNNFNGGENNNSSKNANYPCFEDINKNDEDKYLDSYELKKEELLKKYKENCEKINEEKKKKEEILNNDLINFKKKNKKEMKDLKLEHDNDMKKKILNMKIK